MAGYSGTPLVRKLGIKPSSRVKTRAAPAHYSDLLEPLPEGAVVSPRLRGEVDIVHIFVTERSKLKALLKKSMGEIPPHGMIWVSWPKRASGVSTDMSEDEVRRAALPLGLVDVKVCAVDETWSGLKLVIRRSLRG